MSRIGKQPIKLEEGVTVTIEGNKVTVKGPKGELTREIPEEILVTQKEDQLVLTIQRRNKSAPALWGLSRALLQNCVIGVLSGFEKKLELVGVGYKASMQGDKKLRIDVGYSHPIDMDVPEELIVVAEKNSITISGIDKQKVGEFAAKIRSHRKPEPYKGKGIKYEGEKIRRKEGKKAATSAS